MNMDRPVSYKQKNSWADFNAHCCFCNRPLKHEHVVTDSSGKSFSVGIECLKGMPDFQLWEAEWNAEYEAWLKKRTAEVMAAHAHD